MDAESIKQLATDVNRVAEVSFQSGIECNETEIKNLKSIISNGQAANREQAGKIDWLGRENRGLRDAITASGYVYGNKEIPEYIFEQAKYLRENQK